MTEKRSKDKGFDNIKHYTETSMTEKEFEVVDDYLVSYDGDYFDLHKLSNIRSLVNVVNYIINENKNMRLIIKRYNNENNELFDENEQLKQEYNKLKHRHSLLHDVCIEAECDRDSYHKDVLSLEKENEQLKKDIKEYEKEALENDWAYNEEIDAKLMWHTKYEQILKENEQLKQELSIREDQIQQITVAAYTDQYKEAEKYRKKFIRVCDELAEDEITIGNLKKENEKLKEENEKYKQSNREAIKIVERYNRLLKELGYDN